MAPVHYYASNALSGDNIRSVSRSALAAIVSGASGPAASSQHSDSSFCTAIAFGNCDCKQIGAKRVKGRDARHVHPVRRLIEIAHHAFEQ
jgi:hypothetical protein